MTSPGDTPTQGTPAAASANGVITRAWQWRSGLFSVRGPRLEARPAGIRVALMIGVVGLCMAVAWDGSVPRWERSILEFINSGPDVIEPIVWVIQQPGVLLFPIAAGAVIVLATRRWHYFLPFLLLPIYKMTIEKGLVKPLVDRSRPYTSIGPSVHARGSSLLDEPSFPSGHSTTAVATGLLIAAFLPRRWRTLPIIWGFGVGAARLYYGEHNTLDVVAGAALAVLFFSVVRVLLINRWVNDGPAAAEAIRTSRDSHRTP